MPVFDLLPKERILWQGRPLRHRLFRPPDALLVPLSVVWCGFALSWAASAVAAGSGPSLFSALWGLPFVLLGLYLVFGRFVVRAIVSRRTQYVITDRRVLIIGGLSGTRTVSAYLASLPPPVTTERSDGSGSLAFGAFPGIADVFISRNGWQAWASEPSRVPVLRHVPEIRRVRDLVANVQAEQGRLIAS